MPEKNALKARGWWAVARLVAATRLWAGARLFCGHPFGLRAVAHLVADPFGLWAVARLLADAGLWAVACLFVDTRLLLWAVADLLADTRLRLWAVGLGWGLADHSEQGLGC